MFSSKKQSFFMASLSNVCMLAALSFSLAPSALAQDCGSMVSIPTVDTGSVIQGAAAPAAAATTNFGAAVSTPTFANFTPQFAQQSSFAPTFAQTPSTNLSSIAGLTSAALFTPFDQRAGQMFSNATNQLLLSGRGKDGLGAVQYRRFQLNLTDADCELIPTDGARSILGAQLQKVVTLTNGSVAPREGNSHRMRAGRNVRLFDLLNSKEPAPRQDMTTVWENTSVVLKESRCAVIVAVKDSNIRKTEEAIVVGQGNSLIAADAPTKVDLPFGHLQLRKGALVMADCTAHTCRIRSLGSPGDVELDVNSCHITMNPGDEVVLADHKMMEDELMPADGIGRRLRTNEARLGIHVHLNDFSVVSLLKNRPYFHALKSLDPRGNLMQRLIKTAVIVEMVKSKRGPYTAGS